VQGREKNFLYEDFSNQWKVPKESERRTASSLGLGRKTLELSAVVRWVKRVRKKDSKFSRDIRK